MRILQIIPSISLVYGGPSQMVRGLATALAAQNVDVTILTTNTNGDTGQPPLDVPLVEPVRENGYQIRYFPCAPFRRYKFSLDLLQWLYSHAAEFDLAHLHALFSPIISGAATVARQRHLPYILRPLGTLDRADLQKKKQLKWIYTALWERANIAAAAAIHFTSQEEARVSDKFGLNPREMIIPLGVNLIENSSLIDARAQLGIPKDKFLVLFLSRIEPKKGLDLLLPALAHLLEQGLDFHLVLAGSNPQAPQYEAKIRAEIEASPLAARTTMPGFVREPLKSALLKQADLFVLPSYYENFGIAVAEAMAAGTAVCISRGVYIWEDVENADAGWVCHQDLADLIRVLTEAIQNLDACGQRGLRGQEYARKHYSWEAIAQETITAYEEILLCGR
ncbi:MAG: hypothetical protein Fur0025_31000 [Oscillatoriaceae cyanobacterium]